MGRIGRAVLGLVFFVGIVAYTGQAAAQEPFEPLCLGCHSAMEGRLKAPTEHWQDSIHRKAGISCEECHGGAAVANKHVSDPSGNKPTIYRGKDLPGMCARCHTDPAVMRKFNLRLDQYPLYKTTDHWKAVEAGNTKAATCISCHGVHGIKQKTDPTSPVFRENIPGTCGKCHDDPKIVGKKRAVAGPYWSGVHGQILKGKIPGKNPSIAPVCSDCHGVHRLHVFASSEEEVNTCATCHSGVSKYFRDSYHVKFLPRGQELRCSSCHDPHNNQHPTAAMLEGSEMGHCGSCHTDPAGRPLRMAQGMSGSISEVEELIGQINKDLGDLEGSGRFNDDWMAKFEDIKNSFKDVGPVVHSLDLVKVKETSGNSLAQANAVHKEILTFKDDLRTRRLGLYVALGIIIANIIIVFAKLKSVPKEDQDHEKS